MTEPIEELRERITEILGEPNEAVVDALLVFATNEVARVAGREMAARWQAEDTVKAMEALVEEYERQVREVEADRGGPIPWTDTITNVVTHIREAIAGPTQPKGWISASGGQESNAPALPPLSAATEAQGTPHDPAECIPCWSRTKHQEAGE